VTASVKDWTNPTRFNSRRIRYRAQAELRRVLMAFGETLPAAERSELHTLVTEDLMRGSDTERSPRLREIAKAALAWDLEKRLKRPSAAARGANGNPEAGAKVAEFASSVSQFQDAKQRR
jgi:hypothetical protein